MVHPLQRAAFVRFAVLASLAAPGCFGEREPSLDTPRPALEIAAAAVVACAGNSGAVLTTYQGVPFYSNGSCTGTWNGEFQCPDAVKRYNRHLDWHGNAGTYCEADALRERNLILLPNESASPGLDGDIVAFDGPSCGKGVGHVGVRCGTPDPRHWELCDQNRAWQSSNDPLRLRRSGGALESFSPNCLVCGTSRPGWDFSDSVGLGAGSHGFTLVDMRLVSANAAAIRLEPVDSSPELLSPTGLRLNPDPRKGGYGRLHVLLRSSGGIRGLVVHFRAEGESGWDDAKAQFAPVFSDRGWTDVVVELAASPGWVSGDRIDQIRIDPVQTGNLVGPRGVIELDWMRFDR
jgi:hypothetical protein